MIIFILVTLTKTVNKRLPVTLFCSTNSPCSVAGHNNESLVSPLDDEVCVEGDAEVLVVHLRNVFDVDTCSLSWKLKLVGFALTMQFQ